MRLTAELKSSSNNGIDKIPILFGIIFDRISSESAKRQLLYLYLNCICFYKSDFLKCRGESLFALPEKPQQCNIIFDMMAAKTLDN